MPAQRLLQQHVNGIIVNITSSVFPAPLVLEDLAPAVTFAEQEVQAGAQLLDAAVDFGANGSAGFNGGRLEISDSDSVIYRAGGRLEVLSILDQGTGTGQIGVHGTSVTYGGTAIGTIDAATNGAAGNGMRVNLLAAATQDAVEALMEAPAYRNTSDGPESARELRVQVWDQTNATTGSAGSRRPSRPLRTARSRRSAARARSTASPGRSGEPGGGRARRWRACGAVALLRTGQRLKPGRLRPAL